MHIGHFGDESFQTIVCTSTVLVEFTCKGKGKGACKLLMEIHLTATECHLPYGITQCYLPPDTSEHTPPLPQPDRLVLDLPTI